MQSKTPLILLATAFAIFFGFLAPATPLFAASHENIPYSLGKGKDGYDPTASVNADAAGNLYSTTFRGGTDANGAVFQLAPNHNGTWTETLIHSFRQNGQDGTAPYSGVIVDANGNLYGTTYEGGSGSGCCGAGCGTVFELTPNAKGGWTETILYSFCSADRCSDGALPFGGLVFDTHGNLYGTTWEGGGNSYGAGVVYELSPNAGKWTETVLHTFCSLTQCSDGGSPQSSLILDSSGNLYGTAPYGGNINQACEDECGIVFRLTPEAGGTWSETVLYKFCTLSNCADGSTPYAGLIFDDSGNPYGTTSSGGVQTCYYGCGVAFKLTPGSGGTWTEDVLYSFCLQSNCADGAQPSGGLVLDPAGNLYGTTFGGGYNDGSVFELKRGTHGAWAEDVLYKFCSTTHCPDGEFPGADLLIDGTGRLYGTTGSGGHQCSCGTVFQLDANGHGKWNEKVVHRFVNESEGGSLPTAALISDAAGNLYGTASQGGASGAACGGHGCGSAFELIPDGHGHWTRKVLHNFQDNGVDGYAPMAALLFDKAGNLYGTTFNGGNNSNGTVFELTPGAKEKWNEKVLYSFCTSTYCPDGALPRASLISDASGNLYGTTSYGGGASCTVASACGTVFELSPGANGNWAETVLYEFDDGVGYYGSNPEASLIFDKSGNLYDTASQGGSTGNGTVFELSPGANGQWTLNVLYNFCSVENCADGTTPYSNLVFDSAGNLYGTTTEFFIGCGNEYKQCGTVFQLSPGSNGQWTETVLHRFCTSGTCTDGASPYGGVIFDAQGNLYATTSSGGAYGAGTVFRLSQGTWKETVLHNFDLNGKDGAAPYAGLIFGAGGKLYGTTEAGGVHGGGTVFEITP
jgi:uncharacterized repeat protein (TIGR03803 family)